MQLIPVMENPSRQARLPIEAGSPAVQKTPPESFLWTV